MGVKTITTIIKPPQNTLLTSLFAIHQELSIKSTETTDDPWFTAAINRISRQIGNYCGRDFGVTAVADLIIADEDPYPYQVPGNAYVLQTSLWPIAKGNPDCTVTQNFGNGSIQTLTEGTDFIVNRRVGQLTRLSEWDTGLPSTWENCPTTVTYGGGFEVESEPWTVPGAPYQIVVLAPNGPWQFDVGVTYADGTALTKVTGAPTIGEYALIPATNSVAPGGYQFAAADAAASVLINYSFVPSEVEDAALRLIAGRFSARGRDPALRVIDNPGVGRNEYWIGAPPMEGSLPAEIARMLAHYRIPTNA